MRNTLSVIFISACILFVCYGAVAWVFVPYVQMHKWMQLSDKLKADHSTVIDAHDTIFTHRTLASTIIVPDFLDTLFKAEQMTSYDAGLEAGSELAKEFPQYPYVAYLLARGYETKASVTGKKELYETAADYYQKAFALFPGRQEFLYPYAFNLFVRGHKQEAYDMLEKLYTANPDIPENNFYYGMMITNQGETKYPEALKLVEYALDRQFEIVDKPVFIQAYSRLFLYFYKHKDMDSLLKVATRLAAVDNPQKDMFAEVVDYIKTNAAIPNLTIKEE